MNLAKPVYLSAGGDFRNPKSVVPSFSRALKACGMPGPRVAYLGVANGDHPLFAKSMEAFLREAGASDVEMVKLARKKANLPAARESLAAADAVFLSGGEVEDGMQWLIYHELVEYLAELRSGGKVFFGLSAGTIMLGTHWVHWDVPEDDSTASLFDCLGFAPYLFDTHAENEDWKELKTALRLLGSGACGYGIPSGGMAVVDADGAMTTPDKALLCFENIGGQIQRIDDVMNSPRPHV